MKIFWDTNLFIYLIEQNATPVLCQKVVDLRKKMLTNADELVTSTLTLGELLVKPLQMKQLDIAEKYRSILKSSSITLIAFDDLVADSFAKIRAVHSKVRPPDAIQLACASTYNVDLFITNDNHLNNIQIANIKEIKALADI